MLRLRKLSTFEHEFVFGLMKANMLAYHELYGIPWDQEWIERNYLDKENLIAELGEERVGFVSLENYEGQLHVHTLQILTQYQNGRVGLYMLRELLRLMLERSAKLLSCKVFKDNPARGMYKRLGFNEVSTEGVLVSMERNVDERLLRYVS